MKKLSGSRRARLLQAALTIASVGCFACEAAPDGETGATPSEATCTPDLPLPPCGWGVCPPGPPSCGPGSASYPHASVRISGGSAAPGQFALYEPAEPAPASAPVIAFLRGFSPIDARPAMEPMLIHFARKGYIVLYAEYGGVVELTRFRHFARQAIADGLSELATGDHVRPDGRFGIFAHSLGTLIALRIASDPPEPPTIPIPSVIVLHDPAGLDFNDLTGLDIGPASLAGMDPGTHLLVIQAELAVTDPAMATNSAAAAAWSNPPLPRDQKNWLQVHSDVAMDWYYRNDLTSDHLGNLAGQLATLTFPLDAIDWWGYWRPTEAAFNEVFGMPGALHAAFCSAAGPECDPVRTMGRWSDGRPVAPIENAADLGH